MALAMWNEEAGLGGGQGRRAGNLSIDGIKDFLCLQQSCQQRACGSPDTSRKNKSRKGVARSYSPQKTSPLLVPMSKRERRAKLAIRAIAMAAQQEEGEAEESKFCLDFSRESPTNESLASSTAWTTTARESSNNRSSTIDSLSEMAFSFDTDEPETLARSQSVASTACCVPGCEE